MEPSQRASTPSVQPYSGRRIEPTIQLKVIFNHYLQPIAEHVIYVRANANGTKDRVERIYRFFSVPLPDQAAFMPLLWQIWVPMGQQLRSVSQFVHQAERIGATPFNITTIPSLSYEEKRDELWNQIQTFSRLIYELSMRSGQDDQQSLVLLAAQRDALMNCLQQLKGT